MFPNCVSSRCKRMVDVVDAPTGHLWLIEESMHLLLKNVPYCISRFDEEGRYIFAGQAFSQLFGLPAEQLIGKRLSEIGDQSNDMQNAALENMVKRTFIDGILRRAEVQWMSADGVRIFEVTNVSEKGGDGRTVSVLSVFLDITERKQIKNELRNSESRLRIFTDHSLDAFFLHGENGMVLDVNNQACLSLGYTRDELIGMSPGQFDADLSQERRDSFRARVHKGEIVSFESHHRRKDGSLFPVEVHLHPFMGGEGRLTISLARDITERLKVENEREKLQAQLAQAQKMESIGRLAGGVAHDFNNFLSAIIGYTELAMQEVHRGDPIFHHLQEVRDAANRSGDLVRQLLAFARKQTVLPKVIDLNDTVTGMLGLLQRMIGEEIHLCWQPADSIWPLKVDPVQIDQILTNLCVNARDAISGTGEIAIETCNAVLDRAYAAQHPGAVPGDYVLLKVSDNGYGMSKETLEHVFEPFFTTKDIGEGTGLGLAMVYGIVKQNRGFIDISSKLGGGTTVSIYLPSHMGEIEQPAGSEMAEKIEQGHETVLIVEDEPVILDIAKLILEQCGYRVLTTQQPDQAIRLAGKYTSGIDLLLTDVAMPGMNGRELADQLLSVYPQMHCLFMSGYSGDAIARRGVLDEGVHFIQKPFSMSDLASKVRWVLDNG